MNKIENAKQMLDIIQPIPADQFCIGDFQDEQGRCCFIGQINKALTGDSNGLINNDSWNGFGARNLTYKFLSEKHNLYASGVEVNNTDYINGYNEPEIKDRLIHLLTDMVIAGY